MASSVFYKWASRKDESRVTFDGTGISVFDLKREIILANNMGKANDFDLYIYDPTSKQGIPCSASIGIETHLFEEFRDDSFFIPRSSSVIVKRLPASRPGKGRASMYANGTAPAMPTSDAVGRGVGGAPTWHKGSMSRRFDGKDETPSSSTQGTVKPVAPVILFSFDPLSGSLTHFIDPYGFECHKRRRSCRNGRYVPGSDSKLGGNTRKDVPVGVIPLRVLSSVL